MALLNDALSELRQTVAALERKLDERTAERDEALAQQTATSEILRAIARSPTDVQPVFETIVGSAARVCEAEFSGVACFDDGLLHLVAVHSMSPEETAAFHSLFPRAPVCNFVMGRAFVEAQSVHSEDVLAEPDYDIQTRDVLQSVVKYRSFLAVPILREGKPIGVIGCGRRAVKPFTATQIELLKTFADQAAIAIANVQLSGDLETRNRDVSEALEQQTATAEILQVINGSPGDLGPVFDAMLEKATRLCEAAFGILLTYDGARFRHAALLGIPPAYAEFMREHPPIYGPGSAPGRLASGERLIHVIDMTDTDLYRSGEPNRRAIADLAGARTVVAVALRKDNALLGAIVVFRREVRPFSEKQLALLENFAAQAVIAMENARLITETREALEQQTATAEVLQVINSSPGDLAPVFDAILEKAHTLCGAATGSLRIFDGDTVRAVAIRGQSGEFADRLRDGFPASGAPLLEPLRDGAPFVHISDVADRDDPMSRLSAEHGNRTVLAVPLRKEDALLGMIVASRQEVRPFTDKQIALLQNFAAQAVIAMENARLLTETREALEQQTATAEVLGVINSSPGDLAPVFDAILEKAHGLCGIALGELELNEDGKFRAVAMRGVAGAFAELLCQPFAPPPGSPPARLLAGEPIVQLADLFELARQRPDDPRAQAGAQYGLRTVLFVPLRKDGVLLGYITAYRREVRPFTEKEIALLQNFAAQAVIAMENARLVTETREALEQQTATAEVLQVINSSPGDLAPVFEAMLDKSMRLCEAAFGGLWTFDQDRYVAVALKNVPTAYAEFLAKTTIIPGPGTAPYRFLRGERLVHNIDLASEEPYKAGDPQRRALVDLGGARTALQVPLRKDDHVLGVITIYRQEVRPFSDKQIALLQNFAAQAVIAMENARLITETREALEQQTATAEVLQVINSSPGDLAPVFDEMLEKATRLCEAAAGTFWVFDGQQWRAAAIRGMPEPFVTSAEAYTPSPNSPVGRIASGERLIHLADLAEEEVYRSGDRLVRAAVDQNGIRTLLSVPLRKENNLLGVFSVYRREVRPFSDKQIALVQSFAAQAVIAMENARLITETREALEQQTATAKVLGVINSSPGDLAPVFDAILEKARSLCGAAFGTLMARDGARFHAVALHGVPASFAEIVRRGFEPHPNSPIGRLAAGELLIHLPDLAEYVSRIPRDRDPAPHAAVELGGVRTLLMVPLRKDDTLLGIITAFRQEIRPFSDKQIALLQNFAAQAVIAMENARLLTETREALEQQTATSEVLRVISSSPGDLAPVFQRMLENAVRICGAKFGTLYLREADGFRGVAMHNVPPAFAEARTRGLLRPPPDAPLGRAAITKQVAHITDIRTMQSYIERHPFVVAAAESGGYRTVLSVPMLKDNELIGAININRQEVRPFTDKQIELVKSFASQAVIAIENARLLNELRDRTDEVMRRETELRVTFDNMADGVVMFDGEMRLAAWNRNFQRLLDLPDALLAERPSYADYIRRLAGRGEFGTGDIAAELSRRLEATGQELRLERTRPDGRVIEVRRNAVPGGGLVLIYSDITERKEAEARLRAARDTAEAALRELKTAQASLIHAEKMASLGQLTAGIAHEIKNPLNFVNNFAGLSVELLDELKEAAAPAVASLADETRAEIDEIVGMLTGNLEKIAEHGRRADGIVRSMLAHSRGGSGERQAVDINSLVEESLSLAYHGARAQDQNFNITLERDLDHSIAPIELVPQDVTRVFLNLFGNGFYAANKRCSEANDPQFKPSLKVTTRDRGEEVEIRVRDNGTGIPPELRDKLFQPFFTTKPTGEGTGLGLSISYDIVTQEHGGTIAVDSRVGEFTEFTIRLPRGRPQ